MTRVRAQKVIIRKSNNEKVILFLEAVDRVKRQVVIDIPQTPYNTRFTFSDVDGVIAGKISLIPNGRQTLDSSELFVDHVSKTVYSGLAGWAGAILNDRRMNNAKFKA